MKHAATGRNLVAAVEASYRKGSWHGPTLHAALRGVGARTALWRPGRGRHNIWELAIHAAYWKFAARRKLARDRGLKFPLAGWNWFRVSSGSEKEWAAARRLLDAQHQAFLKFLRPRAARIVANPAHCRMVFGVAQHDVYHAGQIVLIRKLAGRR